MSDSIWKKEISFGKRKPKADQPETVAAEPKQSIWKKEIGGRKKDRGEAAAAEPKQSIWKKEIGGRKKDRGEAAPGEPKQSIWKKEIGGRKKDRGEAAPAEPKQSIWKKELSLSRKQHEREVDRLAEEAAQAVAAAFAPAPAAPEPPAELLPTAIAEATVAAMPDPTVLELVAPPEPEPAPVSYLSEAVVAASADDAAPVEQYVEQPAEEPVYDAPVEAVAPVAPVEAVAPEPWLAEPELPPAPEAVAPVVVHPPVPAAELPPVVEPKVPFWKKEIGGKKQPKQPKQPGAKGESAPFWKKELSLKRPAKAAVDPEAPTQVAPSASAPFWKRELTGPKLSLPSFSLPRGRPGGNVKRFVGLKIGASQLAAAQVSNNGVAELLQVAREPLAQGVVVAGELREPDALAEALKVFFAKHKLPRKNVRLGIASNRIGVRVIDVVGIEDEKQLANAIQFRAQEALPIPLDEAVLDYRVLDELVDAEGQHAKRVLLVVAYRDLVDRYINACRTAGIALVGIDLEAFALLRSLAVPTDRGDAALVAVSVGHDRSTFAVTDGRVCEFTRVLEWGGWALNVALARALDVAPSEVEEIKRALSLDTGAPVEGLTPEQNAAALDAVRKQLQSFARELVSSLQFYQGQPGSLAIGSITLTGGTAHMPGLAQELERLIGVRVEIGNPLARLKISKKVTTPEPVGSLAVAIGLGIED